MRGENYSPDEQRPCQDVKEMVNERKPPSLIQFLLNILERTLESRHCHLLSHCEQNSAATEKST